MKPARRHSLWFFALILILLALALLSSGCAHQAKHFTAPNAAPIQAASHQLSTAVTQSRAAVGNVQKTHAAEESRLAVLAPKVENLLRLAPLELRPLVEAVQGDVETLKAEQAQTTAQLAEAAARLSEADAAKAQVEKLGPAYLAEVDTLAARANASEAGWAKDSAALRWYRLHWWGMWLVAGLGAAACVLVVFLHFTGRLAVTGAAVAARLS